MRSRKKRIIVDWRSLCKHCLWYNFHLNCESIFFIVGQLLNFPKSSFPLSSFAETLAQTSKCLARNLINCQNNAVNNVAQKVRLRTKLAMKEIRRVKNAVNQNILSLGKCFELQIPRSPENRSQRVDDHDLFQLFSSHIQFRLIKIFPN